MSATNYAAAAMLNARLPHTFNAMQHLVMAMADYQKNRGRASWFGKDKGLAAYKVLEDRLRDTLLAMVLDGNVARNASPQEYREHLIDGLQEFTKAFPNWMDAYDFAFEFFITRAEDAESVIDALLRGISVARS